MCSEGLALESHRQARHRSVIRNPCASFPQILRPREYASHRREGNSPHAALVVPHCRRTSVGNERHAAWARSVLTLGLPSPGGEGSSSRRPYQAEERPGTCPTGEKERFCPLPGPDSVCLTDHLCAQLPCPAFAATIADSPCAAVQGRLPVTAAMLWPVSERHLFAGRTRRRTHLCQRPSITANARRASSYAPSSLDCSGGSRTSARPFSLALLLAGGLHPARITTGPFLAAGRVLDRLIGHVFRRPVVQTASTSSVWRTWIQTRYISSSLGLREGWLPEAR